MAPQPAFRACNKTSTHLAYNPRKGWNIPLFSRGVPNWSRSHRPRQIWQQAQSAAMDRDPLVIQLTRASGETPQQSSAIACIRLSGGCCCNLARSAKCSCWPLSAVPKQYQSIFTGGSRRSSGPATPSVPHHDVIPVPFRNFPARPLWPFVDVPDAGEAPARPTCL